MQTARQPPEVLAYVPPKGNSYGHATAPRSLPRLRDHLKKFWSEATAGQFNEKVTLEVFRASQFDSEDHYEVCFKKVADEFGEPDPMKYGEVNRRIWSFETKDINCLLDFMVDCRPWPAQVLGPVSLSFSYDFVWKDPRTGKEFGDQVDIHNTKSGSLTSYILFMIQRNSFASVDIYFPYTAVDPRTADLLRTLVPFFPFKVSARHFRKAVPLKSKTGYRHLKLGEREKANIEHALKT